MNHITEEQIEWIYTRYDGDMINCANAVARQAVVSYIDLQAKELPDVAVFKEANKYEGDDRWEYDVDACMQTYGAACAAHAREMALSEAKLVAKTTCNHESTEFANGFNMAALNVESAIEALKGK